MMSPLYAPQIDAVIGNLKSDPDLMNQKIHHGLIGIYAKWYKFQTAKYGNDLFFYFGDNLIFTINNQEQSITEGKSGWNLEFLENFVHWLAEKVVEETNKFKINPTAYNHYIRQNLPLTKRYGRIKRQYFWDILGYETIRPDIGLGGGLIIKLKALLAELKEIEKPLFQEMTANVFFGVCEICYDANNYFKNRKEDLSSVGKYLSMADGRDAGLRNIEADSPQEFYNWYHSEDLLGGHPWEICRGGNSTHISLFVSENDGKWAVRLAGSSIVRVEETVRMALALYENKIPFELSDAAQIVDMVSGNDFIGIVPDNIVPRYCKHLFPPKDRIIDFMNLNFEKEFESKIIEKIHWYPLDKIELG